MNCVDESLQRVEFRCRGVGCAPGGCPGHLGVSALEDLGACRAPTFFQPAQRGSTQMQNVPLYEGTAPRHCWSPPRWLRCRTQEPADYEVSDSSEKNVCSPPPVMVYTLRVGCKSESRSSQITINSVARPDCVLLLLGFQLMWRGLARRRKDITRRRMVPSYGSDRWNWRPSVSFLGCLIQPESALAGVER